MVSPAFYGSFTNQNMPMKQSFTLPFNFSDQHDSKQDKAANNKVLPPKRVVNFLLAYSKSLEVKKKYLYQLN